MSQFCVTNLITERKNSRKFVLNGVNSTQSRTYDIWATSNLDAVVLLQTTAPLSVIVDSIPLEAVPVLNLQEECVDASGAGKYVGTAEYKHVQRDEQTGDELVEENDERVSFSFGPERLYFQFALSQTEYPATGESATTIGKFLHVDETNIVQGLEFEPPSDSFSVTKVFPVGFVTNAWIADRRAQRNTTNNAVFRGQEIGDCLFLGFSGDLRSDNRWEIDFEFASAVTETLTEINDVDLGGSVAIEGFQYTWVRTRNESTGPGGYMIPKATHAYIADLFAKTNFADLGVTI